MIVAVGALAAAQGAQGGVQHAGGVAYAGKTVHPGPGYAKAKVNCPKGTHVVSGGESNDALFGHIRLHHSHPIDGTDDDKRPDDGWAIGAQSNGDFRITVFAVCVDRKVRYVTKKLAADSLDQTNFTIDCPSGTSAVGGGDQGRKALAENSGWPVPEGWTFFIDNSANQALPLTGYAICVKFGLEVSQLTTMVPGNSQLSRTPACPAHRFVVGGGTSNGGGTNDIAINSTYPNHSTASWTAYDDNQTGSPISMTVMAVCAKKLN